jgi:hypothetical protein
VAQGHRGAGSGGTERPGGGKRWLKATGGQEFVAQGHRGAAGEIAYGDGRGKSANKKRAAIESQLFFNFRSNSSLTTTCDDDG